MKLRCAECWASCFSPTYSTGRAASGAPLTSTLGVSAAAVKHMNVKSVAVGISFVLVTLLGNGAFWESQKAQIEKQRMELEAE